MGTSHDLRGWIVTACVTPVHTLVLSIVLRKIGYNPNYFILFFLNRGRTTFATTTYSGLEASRMHSFLYWIGHRDPDPFYTNLIFIFDHRNGIDPRGSMILIDILI